MLLIGKENTMRARVIDEYAFDRLDVNMPAAFGKAAREQLQIDGHKLFVAMIAISQAGYEDYIPMVIVSKIIDSNRLDIDVAELIRLEVTDDQDSFQVFEDIKYDSRGIWFSFSKPARSFVEPLERLKELLQEAGYDVAEFVSHNMDE